MVLTNKTRKYLIIILSTTFVLSNASKVLADSKLPVNTNKQIQFLEEKRISQNLILEEKRKNSIVEGMTTSKDLENRRNIEKENEIESKQIKEDDTFSQVVKSIKRLKKKRRESKKTIDEEAVDRAPKADDDYKKTETPVVKDTIAKSDRLQLSQPATKIEDDMTSNSLAEKNEITKDLIDKTVLHSQAIEMNDGDIEMLERIVMAESGGEPYLGQIAVANVVLNRVKSKSYPSTLEGVVFQKFQFSPVKNGVIRGQSPNESVKKAVAEALNGRMIVAEDTLYFVNPVLATDQTVPRTKTPVKVIGNHTFYK